MKKLLSALVVLSLVVAASAAFAATSDSLDVSLSVAQYATVTAGADVIIPAYDPTTDGVTNVIKVANFTYDAGANYPCTVAYTLESSNLPGTKQFSDAPSSIQGNVVTGIPASLTLSGLDLTTAAGSYAGTVVISVTPLPAN